MFSCENLKVLGGCPICNRNDGYINARNDLSCYCRTHRIKWSVIDCGWIDGYMDFTKPSNRDGYGAISAYRETQGDMPIISLQPLLVERAGKHARM
jgi:hypothetical protein